MRTTRKKRSPKAGRRGPNKFSPTMYVTVYEQARAGQKVTAIAEVLGVRRETLVSWLDTDPALKDAFRRGRGAAEAGETLAGYVYGSLPPAAKKVWDRLNPPDDRAPEVRAEELLAGRGKKVRQQLFLHALVTCNFSKTDACRKVGVPPDTVDGWLRADPDFVALVNGIHEVKKDFVQSALFDLIRGGDSAATVFAAKTLLKDRGFDQRVTVDHQHAGTVTHAHVTLDAVVGLLSPAARREVLEAFRTVKAQLAGGEGPRQVQALPAHHEGG